VLHASNSEKAEAAMKNGIAIVTGAQRGIGRAIALALADAKFDVAAIDVADTDELKSTRIAIEQHGVNAMTYACDIADIKKHQQMLESVTKKLGPATALVNNAGVSVLNRGDLLDVSEESFDRCLNVNTRGTFFLTQMFARHLLQVKSTTHRSIITVTSANVTAVSVARGEYCMSKAAASMGSRLFAARLADEGIGVYEIQPGVISTEMIGPARERYQKMINEGLTEIKRMGQPEEVGRIASTLALGLLPYTSGQVIHADGGILSVRY
jgi:NAD(P)-dependent dehydrogenase (short-subunit alcohol dehydrogenase family)